MALGAASWEVGFVLAEEPLALWPIAGCVCLFATAATLALERFLPAELRRTPSG